MQNTEENKSFIKEELRTFIIVNLVILGCIFVAILWRYLPALHVISPKICPFVAFFHIYCPGCGGTRAVYHLMDGHPVSSFLSHPIVLYTAALFVDYEVGAIITLIKKSGKRYYWITQGHAYAAIVLIVVFFVLRNVALYVWHIDYLGDITRIFGPL